MSRIRRCLVNGCSSTSETASVCWWPRTKQVERAWIELLTPRSRRLTSSLLHKDHVTRNSCVCKLHFEKKFFNSEKRVPLSWPTLFTKEEILSGKPTVPVTVSVHDTKKRRHNDHNYFEIEIAEKLVRKEIDQVASNNPDEFNPPLPNNDAVETGEPRQNEKTEVDCTKPYTGSNNVPSEYAEGIPDFDASKDQESTFQNLQGSKSAQSPIFSWEMNVEDVPADDGDAVVYLNTKPAVEELPPEISLYCDDDSNPENDLDKAPDYQCNECQEVISGFRYTCVQCADWDLCAACEARAAHATHYVLRVPGERPYSEIQAVLAAIRQQILSENLFLNPVDDSLKMEIKSESGEEPPDPNPESVPPPNLDLDSLPDLELLPDLDPLPVPDPVDERPDSEHSFTDSSEESDNEAAIPSRPETPDLEYTQTEYLVSSSDSDANQSPPRKRQCITPIETHEEVAHEPVTEQNKDIERLARYLIQPRKKISRRDLTKIHPSQIPEDILANLSITSKSLRPVRPSQENPASLNQGVTRPPRNPVSLVKQHRKIIEEPLVSIPQQASTFVPSILKRGRPRKLDLVDSATHRTDHQRQVESEKTFYLEEFLDPDEEISEIILDSDEENSEQIQESHLEEFLEEIQDCHEENSERIQESHLEEFLEQNQDSHEENWERIQESHLEEFLEEIQDSHEENSEQIQESDLEEFLEQIQDSHEENSERILDAHVENVERLNEPSEFCLRLPAGTHEESLIQALQCPVIVRLQRDF